MADNNSYEINVTLDDFNGIITKNPNGDGTYNVTYTSLTKDQINEIGQQFAKHLSDTDENGNSKAGLHKVALTGDYTQLENKPSASNLQGFHEVAFSGQASALDNGTGNNVTFLTKTAFDKSVAGKIKQSDVNSWNAKSDFSGNYEDLNGAPALPEDIDGESEAYETNNGQRKIKSLKTIAFTNNYNDLENLPSKEIKYLNIASFFINDENYTIENQKMYTLGVTDTYVLNFNQLIDINNNLLTEKIKEIFLNFATNHNICLISNSVTNYIITDIKYYELDNEHNPDYIIINYTPIIENNYYDIRNNNTNITDQEAQEQLNELTINYKYGYLIFDYTHNVIYNKIKNG